MESNRSGLLLTHLVAKPTHFEGFWLILREVARRYKRMRLHSSYSAPDNLRGIVHKSGTFMRRYALFTVPLCLLLMVPITCFGFSGKVTFPDGSPAIGAQVNLSIDDTSTIANLPGQGPRIPALPTRTLGNVSGISSPPDINTVAPQGIPIPTPKIANAIKCDAAGRFDLPNQSPGNAMVQIKAPDGRDFASVILPASLFVKGDVAIVLQPK